jgi:hypothetical protein
LFDLMTVLWRNVVPPANQCVAGICIDGEVVCEGVGHEVGLESVVAKCATYTGKRRMRSGSKAVLRFVVVVWMFTGQADALFRIALEAGTFVHRKEIIVFGHRKRANTQLQLRWEVKQTEGPGPRLKQEVSVCSICKDKPWGGVPEERCSESSRYGALAP